MAEILNLDTSDNAYRYNHGKNGWSWNEVPSFGNPSKTARYPEPKATGRSQMFGDGHVRWRGIAPEQNLPTVPSSGSRMVEDWNGPGSGWMSRDQDISYF